MKLLRDPAFLAACAASALSVALQLSSGMYEPVSLAIATAVALVAISATFVSETRVAPSQIALGAGILYGLYCHIFLVPTFYADARRLQGFRGLALFAALFLSAYTCMHLRASLRKLRFYGVLVIAAAMGLTVIYLSPRPWIDVWVFRVLAGDLLRHGGNPYTAGYPNIYGAQGVAWYGDLLRNGRVFAYPYPPMIPLLDAAFPVDPRFVNLAGLLVSAWALGRISLAGEVAAGLLLFQGRTYFVLEQAWTEPITLAAFCLALLFCLRPPKRVPQWVAIGLAMGFCAATKQYTPLLVAALLAATPRGLRLKAGALALGVVVATMLPFAVWSFRDFLDGVVINHFHGLRPESLSLLTLWARHAELPRWAGALQFVAGFGVLAVSLRRPGVARAVTGVAAAWLILVLLSLQAFCNYDWLGGGLLCAAVAAWAPSGTKETAAA